MALQDVLAGFQNPAASRTAILQRLGIDPNRAAGYGGNTQFDQRMADLYTQGLQSSASLDTQEGDINRQYDQTVAKTATDRARALELVKGNLAQRGMFDSGAGQDEITRTNSDYDTYLANIGEDKKSGLNAIGTGRTNLLSALTQGQQVAEGGYGNDVAAFLQQQAIDMWNAVVQQNQANAWTQQLAGLSGGGGSSYAPQQAAPRQAPAPAPRAAPARPVSSPVQMNYSNYRPPAPSYTQAGVYAAPTKKPLTPIRGNY